MQNFILGAGFYISWTALGLVQVLYLNKRNLIENLDFIQRKLLKGDMQFPELIQISHELVASAATFSVMPWRSLHISSFSCEFFLFPSVHKISFYPHAFLCWICAACSWMLMISEMLCCTYLAWRCGNFSLTVCKCCIVQKIELQTSHGVLKTETKRVV